MDEFRILILVNALSAFATAVTLVVSILSAKRRQNRAYSGDSEAARRIILPCFRPLLGGIVVFYSLYGLALCLTFTDNDGITSRELYKTLEYYNFCVVTVYLITPVLLMQPSVSISSFKTTFLIVFPFWFMCSILWGVSFAGPVESRIVFISIFIFFASAFPFGIALAILTKLAKSRVQLGSVSNRNSVELLLIYSLVFGVLYTVGLFGAYDRQTRVVATTIMTVVACIVNQLFPFALYRTLLADTKFWRGLGRHNQGGIKINDDLRASGVSVFRPTVDLSIVSSTLQNMMADMSDISIDFAYLQLDKLIGHGATSEVYCGKYKSKLVAIKLSTPPELTDESIDEFVAEARIASGLKHVNIVQFVGICVRPPQIAMVFEYCDGGNLKANLTKNPARWKPIMRLRACHDAAKAIRCLHEHQFIHRDLKAENFFVGRKNIVKLGDFGESTRFRSRESTATKRMTILGTVAFMAPELINAAKHYDQAIDVYALGITFWEIWTGRDPYAESGQFEIYSQVAKGQRPDLPDDAPQAFTELLTATWHENPQERPPASEVVTAMEKILFAFIHAVKACLDDGDGGGGGCDGDGDAAAVERALESMRATEYGDSRFTMSDMSAGASSSGRNSSIRSSINPILTAGATSSRNSSIRSSINPILTAGATSSSSRKGSVSERVAADIASRRAAGGESGNAVAGAGAMPSRDEFELTQFASAGREKGADGTGSVRDGGKSASAGALATEGNAIANDGEGEMRCRSIASRDAPAASPGHKAGTKVLDAETEIAAEVEARVEAEVVAEAEAEVAEAEVAAEAEAIEEAAISDRTEARVGAGDTSRLVEAGQGEQGRDQRQDPEEKVLEENQDKADPLQKTEISAAKCGRSSNEE